LAAGMVVQDAEHPVAPRLVESRSSLEAERVEVRVSASALARMALRSLEQLASPACSPAVLVDPEELDVQPCRPDVAEHAPADVPALVAQEDRDGLPVVAARHGDVPAVEAIAQRLLVSVGRRLGGNETERRAAGACGAGVCRMSVAHAASA